MDLMIPSTTAGMAFAVSVYKPQGRPPYVSAMEVTPGPPGSIHSFTCLPMSCRSHRVFLQGNNTKGNRAKAMTVMMADLVEKGWITAEDAAKVTP